MMQNKCFLSCKDFKNYSTVEKSLKNQANLFELIYFSYWNFNSFQSGHDDDHDHYGGSQHDGQQGGQHGGQGRRDY